jgi:hypothetical protein
VHIVGDENTLESCTITCCIQMHQIQNVLEENKAADSFILEDSALPLLQCSSLKGIAKKV